MIEIPHGWTNVILHTIFQRLLRQKAVEWSDCRRGIDWTYVGQACYVSAAHPQQSKAVLDRKSRQPQVAPYVHHTWYTDTKIDVVKAQEMGLKFTQTFSCAVFNFGDIPAECTARVVGHDQTILYERPSEVAPTAPAIQADFFASGDRLLDLDQQQIWPDLTESCVTFIFAFHQ